ncbi:MAG: hypothetical protein QXR53_04865 [Candidatus Norongarragalinales archaeon]
MVLDSAKECHVVTSKALERHKGKVEKAFGEKLKAYPYSSFYADRPFVDKAHHYFVHAISLSFMGKSPSPWTQTFPTACFSRS